MMIDVLVSVEVDMMGNRRWKVSVNHSTNGLWGIKTNGVLFWLKSDLLCLHDHLTSINNLGSVR